METLYRLNLLLRIFGSFVIYFLFIKTNNHDGAKEFAAYSVSLGFSCSLELGLSFSLLRGRMIQIRKTNLFIDKKSFIYTIVLIILMTILSVILFFGSYNYVNEKPFSCAIIKNEFFVIGLLLYFITRIVYGFILRVNKQKIYLYCAIISSLIYAIIMITLLLCRDERYSRYIIDIHYMCFFIESILVLTSFILYGKNVRFAFFYSRHVYRSHLKQVFGGGSLSCYGSFVKVFITKITLIVIPNSSIPIALVIQRAFEVICQLSNITFYASLPYARTLTEEKSKVYLIPKKNKMLKLYFLGSSILLFSCIIVCFSKNHPIVLIYLCIALFTFYYFDRLQALFNQLSLLYGNNPYWRLLFINILLFLVFLIIGNFTIESNTVLITLLISLSIMNIIIYRSKIILLLNEV